MSKFAYLSVNGNRFAAAAATLAASSAVDGFPASSAISLPISKPHRFSGCASENYQIDTGAAGVAKALAVVNHNLTAGATITINAGDAADPDGSQWTRSVSYHAGNAFLIFNAQVTYRYWKVIIANAGNPVGYIQIGYLMLCPLGDFTFDYAYGWRFRDEFLNARKETEFGTPHVTRLYQRVAAEFPFVNLSASEMSALRAFVLAHYGDLTPFFLIPDITANDGYFGRLVNESFEQEIDFYRTMRLQFREDSPGRTLI